MQDYMRLLLIVTVSTIVIGSGFGLALIAQPQPVDPFEGVSFTTDKPAYSMGETVAFTLRNDGHELFLRDFWKVERFVETEWRMVECHLTVGELVGLEPGGNLTWPWYVGDQDPEWLLQCGLDAPPVDPGLYRGGVGLALLEEPGTAVQLYVEFAVL